MYYENNHSLVLYESELFYLCLVRPKECAQRFDRIFISGFVSRSDDHHNLGTFDGAQNNSCADENQILSRNGRADFVTN